VKPVHCAKNPDSRNSTVTCVTHCVPSPCLVFPAGAKLPSRKPSSFGVPVHFVSQDDLATNKSALPVAAT